MEAATQFGSMLFEELVAGPGVREVYTTARHDAGAAGRGLRVTLSLRASPELAGIPWEFLYDRPRFLAQHVNSPVVRFVDLENPPPPLRIEAPLRVLGMVSRPQDDELAALDVEEEQEALQRRLSPLIESGSVTLTWLPNATLGALQQEVDHGQDFHVFHYVGHGEYDEETRHSALILEHADGRPRRVGGQQLGALLCDRGSLRLAVLNACEAAQTAPQDPLAGIATSLMEYGVPGVVAMQFAITDTGALTFADEFYASLAAGYTVDAAVTQGRRALAADSDVEWGTPVLFMRVLDGRLFDLGRVPALRGPEASPAPPATSATESAPDTPTSEPEPDAPPARAGRLRSRPARAVAAALIAVIVAAVVVVVVGSSGGGGSNTTSIISISPEPALAIRPIPELTTVDAKQVHAPGGYQYRVVLSRVRPKAGAAPQTPVDYYFTLSTSRANHPFVVTDRLKLPYTFTADSVISDFTLDPAPDGSAAASLSWYVKHDDKNDVTHYFNVMPNDISFD